MNDDREFGYKQLAIESDLKQAQNNLVNMLVIALLAMDSYVPHEVVYFTKTKLTDELIALHPAVAQRLGRKAEVQS